MGTNTSITTKEEYEEAKTKFYYETIDELRGACVELAFCDDVDEHRGEQMTLDGGERDCELLAEKSYEFGTEDDQDEFNRLSHKFDEYNGGDQDDYSRLATCVKEFAVDCKSPDELEKEKKDKTE